MSIFNKDKKDENEMVYDPVWGYRSRKWLEERGRKAYNPLEDEGIYDDYYVEDLREYDYDFSRPAYQDESKEKNWWKKEWDEYESTGVWRGYSYYRKTTIDYKYIDQMANVFSAQHNVKVQIGSEWKVDLEKKVLTYDPVSLMYGTKGDALASLLHHIGTIRFVTATNALKAGKYLTQYGRPASDVLDVFEDRRSDELMSDSYPAAKEIMAQSKAFYTDLLEKVMEQDKIMKNMLQQKMQRDLAELLNLVENLGKKLLDDASHTKYLQDMARGYGIELDKMVEFARLEPGMTQQILKVKVTISQGYDTVYGYIAALLDEGYRLDKWVYHNSSNRIKQAVDDTMPFFDKVMSLGSSQETLDMLETDVYGKIEDLLKNFTVPPAVQMLNDIFGEGYGKELNERMGDDYRDKDIFDENGDLIVKDRGRLGIALGAGRGNAIPQDWANGDYESLRSSVGSAVRELTRKLKNLRAIEQTKKFTTGHKRGKLNPKAIYQHASGNRRLFKKVQELRDTVRSFAFSFMFDRSGSMAGPKVIHSMRAMIVLMEVFTSLGVPFEVIAFGDGPHVLKSFGDTLDKTRRDKMAGMINACNTGTELASSLRATGLDSRPERNKTLIVISDGDLGDTADSKTELARLAKAGVKTLAYALMCDVGPIANVFGKEHSEAIKDAIDIPDIFDRMFRTLLKEKGVQI